MNQHSFCREQLKRVLVEVRKKFSPEEIKRAWVWSSRIGNKKQREFHGPLGMWSSRIGNKKQWEFHGPNEEYIYNLDADCSYSAEASGWSKLMERLPVNIAVSRQEFDTIIAALRMRQGSAIEATDNHGHEADKAQLIERIASEHGEPLTAAEIDALIERINS